MKFQDQVTVIEQHAEQLRADVMEKMFSAGAEYTEALSEVIADAIESAQEKGNVNQELFAKLAEIGWCEVFCRHARSMS